MEKFEKEYLAFLKYTIELVVDYVTQYDKSDFTKQDKADERIERAIEKGAGTTEEIESVVMMERHFNTQYLERIRIRAYKVVKDAINNKFVYVFDNDLYDKIDTKLQDKGHLVLRHIKYPYLEVFTENEFLATQLGVYKRHYEMYLNEFKLLGGDPETLPIGGTYWDKALELQSYVLKIREDRRDSHIKETARELGLPLDIIKTFYRNSMLELEDLDEKRKLARKSKKAIKGLLANDYIFFPTTWDEHAKTYLEKRFTAFLDKLNVSNGVKELIDFERYKNKISEEYTIDSYKTVLFVHKDDPKIKEV